MKPALSKPAVRKPRAVKAAVTATPAETIIEAGPAVLKPAPAPKAAPAAPKAAPVVAKSEPVAAKPEPVVAKPEPAAAPAPVAAAKAPEPEIAAKPAAAAEEAVKVTPAKTAAPAKTPAETPVAKKVIPMTAMPTTPFKGYDDFTAFSKANLDAFIQANQVFAKGIEEMSKEFMSLTQSNMESAAAAAKAVFTAKTFKDVVELNTDYTKTSFDKFVANSTKLSEMGVKIATDAMAPVTARVNVAVEKMLKPVA